jgi:hypothetical protein
MQNMFYTPAHLEMHVQCYHFENRQITEKDAQGNTRYRTERVRVDTHHATERFYYVSWRDISGKFVLDTSGVMANEQKAFVKLHLKIDLQFSNDGTRGDYERQRDSFKWRNNRDTHQDYSEHTAMDGFVEFNLIKVSDIKPKCFGLCWYILFTFLTVAEFYKMYVDKFCIVQNFTLTKVVSSKRDLNQPEVFVEYQQLLPCIVYMGQVTSYAAPCVSVKLEMPSYEINLNAPPPVVVQAAIPQVTMQMNAPQPNVVMHMNVPQPTMNMQMNVGMPSMGMQVNMPGVHVSAASPLLPPS